MERRLPFFAPVPYKIMLFLLNLLGSGVTHVTTIVPLKMNLCLYFLMICNVRGLLHRISTPNDFAVLVSNFYEIKTETRYQCMEICGQFSMCKSLTYHRFGTCYLHDRPKGELMSMFTYNGFPEFIDATEMIKELSGACRDHDCNLETRCVPTTGIKRWVCVPHGIPTFTCKPQWMRRHSTCYRPFVMRKTWQEAKEYCLAENSTLAEIHSSDVWSFIKRILTMYSMPNHYFKAAQSPGTQSYWIALTDQTNEGQWTWGVSGRYINSDSFTKWSSDSVNSQDKDCVGLPLSKEFHWMTTECDQKLFFVCEMTTN